MMREVDERILETKRKMAARGFQLFLWGILIDLLYRQLYLGQEFGDYGDIFIVWLAGCTYVSLGEVLHGVTPFGQNRLKLVLVPAVMALTIVGVGLWQGTIISVIAGVSILIFAFLGSALMLALLYWLYRRWEKRTLGGD